MTPQEAKAQFEQNLCALPSIEEAGATSHKVEIPTDILCGDMMGLVQNYEEEGWYVSTGGGQGNFFWFATKAWMEKNVRDAHEQAVKDLRQEIADEEERHRRCLLELHQKLEDTDATLTERLLKVAEGKPLLWISS
jgi:phage terminase Nu1 subunit (DNA packaging protein)